MNDPKDDVTFYNMCYTLKSVIKINSKRFLIVLKVLYLISSKTNIIIL